MGSQCGQSDYSASLLFGNNKQLLAVMSGLFKTAAGFWQEGV
jgi:hypothetical protein